MADPVLTQKDGDITTITLNRPEAGNRQTDATWAEVTRMLDAAATTSRLILFKGAGEDFCLGREAMGQQPPAPLEAYAVRDRSELFLICTARFVIPERRSSASCRGAPSALAAPLPRFAISPLPATGRAFHSPRRRTASCRPSPSPRWSTACPERLLPS